MQAPLKDRIPELEKSLTNTIGYLQMMKSVPVNANLPELYFTVKAARKELKKAEQEISAAIKDEVNKRAGVS